MWMQDGETDIRLGIVPRFFFSRDKVAPYIGGRIGLMWRNSNTGWSEPDWLIGGAFGGEYFVDQHFSLGIESQVNLTISNTNSSRFGNPGKKNINTATAFFATVYF